MKAICGISFKSVLFFLIGFHFTFKICSFDLQASVAELRLVDRKELVGVSAGSHPSKHPQAPPLSVSMSGSHLAQGSCLSLLPTPPHPSLSHSPHFLPTLPSTCHSHTYIHSFFDLPGYLGCARLCARPWWGHNEFNPWSLFGM